LGEDCRSYRRDSGNGYLAREGRVAEDLGGCVEVSQGVGGDDHDCFLGLGSVRGVRVLVIGVRWGGWYGLLGCWREGVGEKELGELALAERDEVWLVLLI